MYMLFTFAGSGSGTIISDPDPCGSGSGSTALEKTVEARKNLKKKQKKNLALPDKSRLKNLKI